MDYNYHDATAMAEEASRAEPEHSPLGGSGAERWMNCPGSNVILKKLELPETDEPEYRSLGKAAHECAETCLRNEQDTWEVVGQKFGEHVCDEEMAQAVQEYLSYVRPMMPNATVMIEQRIGQKHRPHPLFFGTVDFAAYGAEALDVVDYKHGEGIVVDPDDNAQMKYYAYGILHDRIASGVPVRSDRIVRLHIVQPRAFHFEGACRMWETTAGEIIWWAENELLPAMEAAEIEQTFNTGKWCRFCPAKLVCPQLTSLFGAAVTANPEAIKNFSTERLGLEYQQREAVKFYLGALEQEVFARGMRGEQAPGTKMVQKQARRVWNTDAREALFNALGQEALTQPALKSPAEMEKISPAAKKLVHEYAYTPNTGLTVALDSDRRLAVPIKPAAEMFGHIRTNGDTNE